MTGWHKPVLTAASSKAVIRRYLDFMVNLMLQVDGLLALKRRDWGILTGKSCQKPPANDRKPRIGCRQPFARPLSPDGGLSFLGGRAILLCVRLLLENLPASLDTYRGVLAQCLE